MSNDKEKKLVEQRTIQATHNGYMGLSGKFSLIAKFLGQEIVAQDGGSVADWMSDVDWNPAEIQARMPYLDTFTGDEPTGDGWRESRSYGEITSTHTRKLGWHFDGLSRGLHLEIKVLADSDEGEGVVSLNEIVVHYKGYVVYKESAGELHAYVPDPRWEDKVEAFAKAAMLKEKDQLISRKENRIQKAKKESSTWIESMKTKWGI